MGESPVLCVAANPSVDAVFTVERLSKGRIHRPLSLVRVPGGKGLNVARSIALLGGRCAVVGIVGGHAGRWIAERIEAAGIAATWTWTATETRQSLSVADESSNRLTEFYETGGPIPEGCWDAFVEAVRERMSEATWMVLSGSLPLGAPDDGYAGLIAEARRQGLQCALDTRDESLRRGASAGPDVLKVNRDEAAELLDAGAGRDARSLAASIRSALPPPGGTVVVTDARRPTHLVTDGFAARARGPARGAYPVGSGDAFLAGLVVERARGSTWSESLRLAVGAAGANAEVPGPGTFDPTRAYALAKSVEVSDETP